MFNIRMTSGESVSCVDCRKQSFWCSEECKQSDEIHKISCKYLAQLPGIAGAAYVDYNLLKLIIFIVSRKHLEKNSSLRGTPIEFLMDLISHHKSTAEKFKEAMEQACTDLIELFQDGPLAESEIKDLVKLACRINSNSHAVHDPTGELNQPIGVGMFPLVAMLNHSCSPNAVFVTGSDGSMNVRAIKNIKEGQEICVSYIDLFSPKWERQGELLTTKHFWCECPRCKGPEKGFDPDHLMNSAKCQVCSSGALIPQQIGTLFNCNNCSESLDGEAVQHQINMVDVESGMDLYRAGLFSSAQISLERELQKSNQLLHEHHYKKFTMSANLISLCCRQNKFIEAEEYCSMAIQQMKYIIQDGNMSENIPELANLYEKRGEILEIIAAGIQEKLIDSKQPISSIEKEMKDCYSKCRAIKNFCFGIE